MFCVNEDTRIEEFSVILHKCDQKCDHSGFCGRIIQLDPNHPIQQVIQKYKQGLINILRNYQTMRRCYWSHLFNLM